MSAIPRDGCPLSTAIWAAVFKFYSFVLNKLIEFLHLALATTGLLHGIAQLGIRILPLQLLVNLGHKLSPLGHLLAHLAS